MPARPPSSESRLISWLFTALAGAAGVLFLAFFVHWYEAVIFPDRGSSARQLIVNSLAPIVLFMVFLVLVPWNYIWSNLFRALVLDRRQLTVIISMWLICSGVTYVYLTSPVLHTAGNLSNPAYGTSALNASGALDTINPKLFVGAPDVVELSLASSDPGILKPPATVTLPAWTTSTDVPVELVAGQTGTAELTISSPGFAATSVPIRAGPEGVKLESTSASDDALPAFTVRGAYEEGLLTLTIARPLSNEGTAYTFGKSEDTSFVPFSEVPWENWSGPLGYWVPFMLVVIVMSMSLVRMVYRQWSRHELLTFPLADVADSLIARKEGERWPTIFRDNVFWCGFICVALLGLINGYAKWVPQMIEIPLRFSHTGLVKEFPFLSNYCGTEAYSLFRGMAYPAIIAIAVLLPTEISLTAWGGWVLMILGTGVWFLITGNPIGRAETQYVNLGSMVALLGMLLYIGRREWVTIIKWACLPKAPTDPELGRAVWACRIFVISSCGLWAMLVVAGFDWVLGIILVLCMSLILLLSARMTAEMGFPWLSNMTGLAAGLPVKILGGAALGPSGLAAFYLIGALLTTDMTNSIVAQETTLARLRDKTRKLPSGLYHGFIIIGVCLAVMGSITFTLWSNYSFGAQRETMLTKDLRGRISTVAKESSRLKTQGVLAETGDISGLERLAHIETPTGFWTFFLLGAILVAGCSFMRLRYTWWPFHPLPLLFFGTWAMSRLYLSFMIGWLIKIALLKIGGGKVFSRLKPFFIGVIIGQVAILGFWVICNVIFYLKNQTIEPDRAIYFFI